jgi:hypothetical protein
MKPAKSQQASAQDVYDPRNFIQEVQEEWNDFKATKQTISELMNYRRSLMEVGSKDPGKIDEIRGKAINAVNDLFDGMMKTG